MSLRILQNCAWVSARNVLCIRTNILYSRYATATCTSTLKPTTCPHHRRTGILGVVVALLNTVRTTPKYIAYVESGKKDKSHNQGLVQLSDRQEEYIIQLPYEDMRELPT